MRGPRLFRERVASLVLRPFFEPQEIQDILSDLAELAERRGRWGIPFSYPAQVVRYAWTGMVDRIRTATTAFDLRAGGELTIGLGNDLRYTARSLRRSSGFLVSVVAILAITIGATTAMYSVVRGVLLEPLPYPDPDRLTTVWLMDGEGGRGRMTPGSLGDVRGLDDVFELVAGFQGITAALGLDDRRSFLRGGSVTHDYFETLGVRPILGREFTEAEEGAGGPPVVVLGHQVWLDAFGADPEVLGRSIDLDGALFEVIGVLPPGIYPTFVNVATEMPFTTANQDFFVPNQFTSEVWTNRRSHILGAVARLRAGVGEETAAAALQALSERVAAAGITNGSETLVVNPLRDEVVGDVRWPLVMILSMLGLVLLIAVVNVGSLFVLRAEDRRSEVGIRVALGADRLQVARQRLIESTVVAGAAAALGVGVAQVALRGMQALVPFQIPRLAEVHIEPGALLVTSAVAVILALVLGLTPARRWGDLAGPASGRRATASPRRRRLQSLVVGSQAGLAVVVLTGAFLLVRSFEALRAVDTGVGEMGTWVVNVQGPGDLDALVEVARGIPGVETASRTYDHPLERNWGDSFLIEGVAVSDGDPTPGGSLRPFGAGYFETVGIDVVEGRIPDAVDLEGPVRYAVINRSLQEQYFPDRTPIGRVIEVPSASRNFGADQGTYEIAAVVEDVRFLGPDRPSEPSFYLPLSHFSVGGQTILIRPSRTDLDVIGPFRDRIQRDFPRLAIESAQPLSAIFDDAVARPRFNMMLLVSFAGFGLILCALGAYGLARRGVASRMPEMAIRMVLGAEGRRLLRSVVSRVLVPVALGSAVGATVALLASRWLTSLLYEISPTDPVSLLAAPTFILVVSGVACLVPARRTLKIDPAETLKAEG